MVKTIRSQFACLLAVLFIGACSQKPNTPNVIILTLDTLRADALGCYGNETIQTPNIDDFANEGVLFNDAICQIPATITSHTAIFTGRYPKSTGVRFRNHVVPEIEETLAECLSQQGYITAAMIGSTVLAPEFGLNQGFDTYNLGSMMQGGNQVKTERRAEEVIDDAEQFLVRHQNDAFFLWLHFYDPHTPYQAPEPYHKMYNPDYSGHLTGSVNEIIQLSANDGEGLSQTDLDHLEALYWGEVSYLDAQLGRLFDILKQRNLYDNSIIVILSDHGENLGEKGHFFHGDTLYNTETHIPLLIRYPDKIPAGSRVDHLVQSIDVFPTVLELLGDEDISTLVEGKSLLGYIKQEATPDTPGFMETEKDNLAQSNKHYAIRSETHKFIYNQLHRRAETPLGLRTELPLKGPSIISARIKGDESIRLMAHVRYRTAQTYTSNDTEALSRLPSTAIYAESFGSDPLHSEITQQDNFLETPEGWRLQATPDLYSIAKNYGESRGWPTQWMVIEGVGVDASLPYTQQEGTFVIDQIEFYAPGLRFPEDSPRYRKPFWVIEDFEDSNASHLTDAGVGPAHEIETSWTNETILNGNRQSKIVIRFLGDDEPEIIDELYHVNDHKETDNLLIDLNPEVESITESSQFLIEDWLKTNPGEPKLAPLSPQQREAMQALGYTQ